MPFTSRRVSPAAGLNRRCPRSSRRECEGFRSREFARPIDDRAIHEHENFGECRTR